MKAVRTVLVLVLFVSQALAQQTNGTEPLANVTFPHNMSGCSLVDTGGDFYYERNSSSGCGLFSTFRNGEVRNVKSINFFGFTLDSEEQKMVGLTSCGSNGNAFWARSIVNAEDLSFYYIYYTGVWFPRKADNSLDQANRKDFSYRGCETAKQIADEEQEELPPSETPIAIDLNNDGVIRLTNVADGVDFDIDADGKLERVAWLADSDDGWLVWDLDDNGNIRSGKYLFGNSSILRAEHGYAVLKLFNEKTEPNEETDTNISKVDGIWKGLKIWRDFNHNGISEPGELSAASEWVNSISFDFKRSSRKDEHGNEFRLRAEVEFVDGRKGFSFDIFLKAVRK